MLGPLSVLVAAVVFFLMSFGVVEDTENVKYLPLALGFWALSFALDTVVGFAQTRTHRDES